MSNRERAFGLRGLVPKSLFISGRVYWSSGTGVVHLPEAHYGLWAYANRARFHPRGNTSDVSTKSIGLAALPVLEQP